MCVASLSSAGRVCSTALSGQQRALRPLGTARVPFEPGGARGGWSGVGGGSGAGVARWRGGVGSESQRPRPSQARRAFQARARCTAWRWCRTGKQGEGGQPMGQLLDAGGGQHPAASCGRTLNQARARAGPPRGQPRQTTPLSCRTRFLFPPTKLPLPSCHGCMRPPPSARHARHPPPQQFRRARGWGWGGGEGGAWRETAGGRRRPCRTAARPPEDRGARRSRPKSEGASL